MTELPTRVYSLVPYPTAPAWRPISISMIPQRNGDSHLIGLSIQTSIPMNGSWLHQRQLRLRHPIAGEIDGWLDH